MSGPTTVRVDATTVSTPVRNGQAAPAYARPVLPVQVTQVIVNPPSAPHRALPGTPASAAAAALPVGGAVVPSKEGSGQMATTAQIQSMAHFDPLFRKAMAEMEHAEQSIGRAIQALGNAPIDPAAKEGFASAHRTLKTVAPVMVAARAATQTRDAKLWELVHNPRENGEAWGKKG